jgi:hypothetical protein
MSHPTNPFRNANNQRYTNALFYEAPGLDKSCVIFTLKDVDHQTTDGRPLKSLYKLYMQESDVTEYDFAIKHLDGLEHWENLCQSTFFKPYAERWRKELELKLKSECVHEIENISKDPDHKSQFAALTFLVNGGWKDKTQNRKGRPSKVQIKEAAREIADHQRRLDEDFARIN